MLVCRRRRRRIDVAIVPRRKTVVRPRYEPPWHLGYASNPSTVAQLDPKRASPGNQATRAVPSRPRVVRRTLRSFSSFSASRARAPNSPGTCSRSRPCMSCPRASGVPLSSSAPRFMSLKSHKAAAHADEANEARGFLSAFGDAAHKAGSWLTFHDKTRRSERPARRLGLIGGLRGDGKY
ncbi:hypothetical protein BD413DRAFT_285267 [Trametes elegans]|nr:hypothetical protein BD413DRAFT_285267 [Trametes elegans]